jgi:hypothetical protein
VGAENRLTTEQLAALSPGDVVTVESGLEFGRRRHTTATVVRVDGFCVTVRCPGPRGGTFVERYGLRDGLRVGGGTRAELVDAQPVDPAGAEQRRQVQRIDALFRAWSRNRRDDEALRRLHAAIGERLDAQSADLS